MAHSHLDILVGLTRAARYDDARARYITTLSDEELNTLVEIGQRQKPSPMSRGALETLSIRMLNNLALDINGKKTKTSV